MCTLCGDKKKVFFFRCKGVTPSAYSALIRLPTRFDAVDFGNAIEMFLFVGNFFNLHA